MKIAYVSNSLIPSRSANSIHVMKMCQALALCGHDVTLLAPSYPEKHYVRGVDDVFDYYDVKKIFRLVQLKTNYSRRFVSYMLSTLIYSIRVGKYLRYLKPDLTYGRYLPGCLAATVIGFKTVYESHGLIWNSTLEGFLFKYFVKSNHFLYLVVISDALKQLYIANTSLHESKIQVAHDGADPVDLNDRAPNWPGRVSSLQAGYFGSLYEGRGIEIILDVAKVVQDVDFHIVGGNKNDIDRLKRSYKGANIFFHGYIAPGIVHQYRNCCDMLLAPYGEKVAVFGGSGDTSAFMSPLKIFEYMASSKAMVVSDMPVLREVLNDDNALLVPPGESDEWCKAIIDLASDNKKMDALGRQAHSDFMQHHTWGCRARNISGFYYARQDKECNK